MPFLVLERGWSYAVAGIVLASSLSSSVVQPLSESFWITAVVAAASGVGVAAFHPAAASRFTWTTRRR